MSEQAPVIHAFCAHCGTAKPADANYVDDCGWVSSTFVFCANCGKRKEPSRNYVHDECLCRNPRADGRRPDWDDLTPDQQAIARFEGTEYVPPTLEQRVERLEERVAYLSAQPSPYDVIG